jgi:anaerobic sulfite reductase subunit B
METDMAVEPLLVSPGPMVPAPYAVRSRGRETADTWTLELEPAAGEPIDLEPGQFAMLTAYGVGEVPISLSSRGADGSLVHTIRDVGPVTAELCRIPRGGTIGVRGPFGTTWPLAEARGADVVVLAGGLGLAPLRPAVEGLLAERDSYGRLLLLYGARTPGDLLYPQQLEDWRAEGLDVHLTVDAGTRSWLDRVGFVSALLDDVAFDPESAVALVCGPEVMMRVTVGALLQRGVSAGRTHVSLERSMSCGIGHCGHCQLGTILICRDGPVFTWAEVGALLSVREL